MRVVLRWLKLVATLGALFVAGVAAGSACDLLQRHPRAGFLVLFPAIEEA